MYMAFFLVMMAYSLMLITGAVRMIRKSSYAWAFACSCLAMVPVLGPFYTVGIPVGVWAIIVLRKPFVRMSCEK